MEYWPEEFRAGSMLTVSSDSDQAERVIRELDELRDRTRTSGRSVATGYPLIGWGFAWAAGYSSLELLDGWWRVAAAVVAWMVGMSLSWAPMRAAVRTGTEGRMQAGWFVLMGASPFIVAAAQPATWVNIALLLGALWSVGMVFYAIATQDVPYAVSAGIGVVAAALASFQEAVGPLLLFGLAAGLPLLAVGFARVIATVRRG